MAAVSLSQALAGHSVWMSISMFAYLLDSPEVMLLSFWDCGFTFQRFFFSSDSGVEIVAYSIFIASSRHSSVLGDHFYRGCNRCLPLTLHKFS